MLDNLKRRALLYQKIRAFFAARNIMEVETPLLCQYTVTDPHIQSFSVSVKNKLHYLQTSPEYAMKRLLASGSGAIYQITRAFRNGELGRQHNPEFSMLEWYRPEFNHHDLMQEVDLLLQATVNSLPAEKISYRELFFQYFNINPLTIDLGSLKKLIMNTNISVDTNLLDHDTALQILLSHCMEPQLGLQKPLFLYDFPPSQAALSKIRYDHEPVAERFELYLHGTEIANGFHELQDPIEQQKRFEQNQLARAKNQQSIPEIDHYFLDALKMGLPNCSGVALGLDRLMMAALSVKNIDEVIAFGFECA